MRSKIIVSHPLNGYYLSMVKITLSNGTVYEGTVFAVDPTTNFVVLRNDKSFQLIPHHSIAAIEGDLPVSLEGQADYQSVSSADALDRKEKSAIESARKQMMSVNTNVSGDVQALFDRLSSIYPCRWAGNSIIILEQCQLSAPYLSNCITAFENCNDAGLSRISRIVDVETKKLKMATESS